MDMCDAQFLFFVFKNLLPISIFFRLVKNQKKKKHEISMKSKYGTNDIFYIIYYMYFFLQTNEISLFVKKKQQQYPFTDDSSELPYLQIQSIT